jgi:hypothetical protein
MSGAYNLYPRLFDISRNGVLDLLRGINWGSVTYWFDPLLHEGLGPSGNLVITDILGASPGLHGLTDGAMVDFGDYNNDGVLDLLVGGHTSSSVYLAYGLKKTVADCISENEAIYDAHPGDLGDALEANGQELLAQINDNSRAIISHMLAATLPERQAIFTQMATHVGSYSFLQMNAPLNTSIYHHVPSIAGQNLITMHQMLPDTPTHRLNVANALGLIGLHRDIYLNSYLHVGDNQNGTQGQLESVRDFMTYEPREIFPDTMLTLDNYYSDMRGGHVNSFTGAKNTFGFGEGGDADEWASDLGQAIQSVFGTNAQRGDYFTLVMGHEACHSLDGYVNSRANSDLRRRWGQMLVHAGGPDIVAGSNGWIDWSATKAHFQTQGYWDGFAGNWDAAWDAYWATGPGSAWSGLSFMRLNIKFFFSAPQESLATQGNHRWMHSEGRLVGAIDRWRRGIENGIDPMKANITEVTTFLDYVSAGLNKVVLYDTHGVSSPYPHATYDITHAWLERNDKGYITKVTTNDHIYEFVVDADGIVTDVTTNIFTIADDSVTAYSDTDNVLDVLANDYTLEGGQLSITNFTQPPHGDVTDNGNDTLTYRPDPGYTGSDSFTYDASCAFGTASATVNISVVNGINDNIMTHLTMDTADISGSTITDFSGAPQYDGTIIDFSGNPAGQINEALTLDGVNGHVTIPAMNLNSNTVTISAWIKRNGTQSGWAGIVFSRSASTIAGIDFGDAHELRYHWNDGYWGWNSGLIVPDNQWSHVALVMEPDKATMYLNGTSATNWTSHGIEEFNGLTRIGKDQSGRLFKGDIDDVAIWNRSLSSAEINYIYQKGLEGEIFSHINLPPEFSSDPFTGPAAIEGVDYSESISLEASDPDGGTISYTKVVGPAWLDIATDGGLTGVPGDNNVGEGWFTVRATDDEGSFVQAQMSISVLNTYSGQFGLADFAGFAAHWQETGCVDMPPCSGADLSGNGDVDTEDLRIFAGNWIDVCMPVSCYVESIVPGTASGTLGREKCQTTVTIYDDCGNSLADATVTGTFTGPFTEQVIEVTDSDGVAVLTTTGQVTEPSFTFCVDEVTHAELTYEPTDNIETCDSY